jgi:NTE family protein
MASKPRPVTSLDNTLLGFWRSLRKPPPRLNLALQGGGSHGAFTWGVLDALLADPRVALEGLSGSSAGALNAVLLADGWCKGGRDGARKSLADFWTALGTQMPPGLVVQGEGDSVSLSAMSRALVNWAAYFSPDQLNPLALSPLRDLLNSHINFEALRRNCPFKLFVGATQANTGRLRVFREHEITPDVLMASTCLPRLHHVVSIDGQPYWDGGYSANPQVFPLVYECSASDILLVLLSPLERGDCGSSVEAIQERIAEITFSANLVREMSQFTQALAHARPGFGGSGSLDRRLLNTHIHMVDSSGLASLQGTGTKLLAHAPFMQSLMRQGQERAHQWLATDFDCVGRRTSVDLEKWFS